MKLSEILKIENINSVAIDVDKGLKVKAYLHFNNCKRSTKTYSTLEIDIELKECNIDTVQHLGVTRYRFFQNESVYANIYNYK